VGVITNSDRYLSTSIDGLSIDVHTLDTGSGRQKWTLKYNATDAYFHIVVYGGTDPGRDYLSTAASAGSVTLVSSDDGSERQRWYFYREDYITSFAINASRTTFYSRLASYAAYDEISQKIYSCALGFLSR